MPRFLGRPVCTLSNTPVSLIALAGLQPLRRASSSFRDTPRVWNAPGEISRVLTNSASLEWRRSKPSFFWVSARFITLVLPSLPPRSLELCLPARVWVKMPPASRFAALPARVEVYQRSCMGSSAGLVRSWEAAFLLSGALSSRKCSLFYELVFVTSWLGRNCKLAEHELRFPKPVNDALLNAVGVP